MIKAFAFCTQSLVIVTSLCAMTSFAVAASRPEPVPIYGSYIRHLDRAKQTFNGKFNPNSRPSKQKEDFFTICKASGCVAHTPNLYAPPGAPKYIEYHWKNNRWELKATHLFTCNDGNKVKSTIFEFFTSNGDGSFSGQRHIKIGGLGCPQEGPGVYKIPFRLIPV
ncbi:hypothetical protein LEAN103870_14585 [Legionella anisa]|uniref:Uncharacterized protein n=1 Tax=Legionella anisa TaxID=28082 RepID=A0AAX0WUE0_9GAMM|nr:hypothetical protein [Legionella anisa]AWN74172.1 hypothetical protein DLD14_10125 [Legionella anisa]KTC71456.1 hypothetical protein Lani_1804 [Legionella anisa]MBN5935198.1 hypothetical protein [Legionella anisa]MCW8425799.1 hypothetical protein [Legionella anisa]MCW8448770.1 hypothetical protein [Legionella anisa]